MTTQPEATSFITWNFFCIRLNAFDPLFVVSIMSYSPTAENFNVLIFILAERCLTVIFVTKTAMLMPSALQDL